jgi:ABC-2 type transport system permease protein
MISLKSSLLYRKGLFFSFFGSVVFITISLLLWRVLFVNNIGLQSYMTKYAIISNVMGIFHCRKITESISKKITSGEFAADMAMPVSFFAMSWQIELAKICARFILCGVPIILVFLQFLQFGPYFNVGFVLLSVVMGHALSVILYSLIGFSAFILPDVWPLRHIMDDTVRLLAGGFIPLFMLPSPILEIARALPFRFLYSFPLEMLLAPVSPGAIAEGYAVLSLWIAGLAAMNILLSRIALRNPPRASA